MDREPIAHNVEFSFFKRKGIGFFDFPNLRTAVLLRKGDFITGSFQGGNCPEESNKQDNRAKQLTDI